MSDDLDRKSAESTTNLIKSPGKKKGAITKAKLLEHVVGTPNVVKE